MKKETKDFHKAFWPSLWVGLMAWMLDAPLWAIFAIPSASLNIIYWTRAE